MDLAGVLKEAQDADSKEKPTPYPKCKLNISSYFRLLHPLDCFICAKDSMIIVLLLKIVEGDQKNSVSDGIYMIDIIFFRHLFCFCILVSCLFLTDKLWFLCLFPCSCFPFFLSFAFFVVLLRSFQCKKAGVCYAKLFQKSSF